MSKDHPEKRPFLHSTSDTDSDIDQETGWGDVSLANQIISGTHEAPRYSYVTHDFQTFRAGKVDPEPKRIVTESSNLLPNEVPEDSRRAEGSLRSVEESIPSPRERRSSRSRYRTQESVPQSLLADRVTYSEEVGERNSYADSGTQRSSLTSSVKDVDTLGQGSTGTVNDITVGFERRSSLTSPVSVVDKSGEVSSRRNSVTGSATERRPLVTFAVSDVDTLRQAVGERTGNTGSGIATWPQVIPSVSNVNTLGEAVVGRSSYGSSSNERPPSVQSVQSPFSEIDSLGDELDGRTTYVGSEEPSSVQFPFLKIDTPREEVGGRSYIGSEMQPSVKSPNSDPGRLREDVPEPSYIDSISEREPSGRSPLLGIDTHGAGVGRRSSNIGSGLERWSVSHIDSLGEGGVGRTSYISNDSERRSSVKSQFSDGDTLREEGARNSYTGSGSERQSSAKSHFLESGGHEEETDERDSYIGSAGARWTSVSQPLLDEVQPTPLREIKRTSVNPGRRASRLSQVSDIDTDGEEVGKNRYIDSGKETRPSVREQVLDEQSELLRDMKRTSATPGRRMSRLSSPSEIDRDPESQLETARERGSVSQSTRRTSRVVSPTSEAESEVEARERDEYGEVDTTDTVARQPSLQRRNSLAAQVGERVPPEWALLLLGCLLGLATGLSVVIFNKGVHSIHDMAWAGTPREGAAWLRLQKLIDVWHRVMLIPVVGGVVVGMMHAVVGILDQVKGSRPPMRRHAIDWLAGVKPTVKAGQAMVTLGTGCSLGPEGPSVDIGKAWAHGLATVMKNNRERRIALVAAGAAAGISAGFNAPVSGMFFAIETVLRPQHAENSPPLTTAMIILASVISSTVSQILLEETAAFTVPNYELRSAAELPLYLLLGGVCGVVSVIFTRLTAYFTDVFEFLRDRIGIPHTVTPAIGGLVTGLVALKYPGVLYWGFYNVDEILHSGKTATAPGAGLVTQLICAKVVATAFCKGSGLVGGVYAPSLFIGAAVGSVYGTMAGKIINAAVPGHDTVAHPQAYALVGMAALLAAVCSVPLTSVLLLFELTKDYHILLPLMGGIGVAIWVAAVAKQSAEKHFASPAAIVSRSVHPPGTNEDGVPDLLDHEQRVWRRTGNGTEVELCTLDDYEGPEVVSDDELMNSVKVSQAMSTTFVKVQSIATVKETIRNILLKQQRCALVVDENDLIEGIFTFSDLECEVMRAAEASARGDRTVVEVDKMLVAAFCSGKGENQGQDTDLVVAFPDLNLKAALDIMESSGFKQLPVVARGGKRWQDEGRQIVGLIDRDAIPRCIREEASKRISAILAKNDEDDDAPLLDH